MRYRVDDDSIALQLVPDAVWKLLRGTEPERALVSLVVVCRLRERSEGFCYSALKLVGAPLTGFEQG